MTNPNIFALDQWLDTMRTGTGYGGPVAHWWQQSLMYCGAGFDWRYEGIIAGYLTLWKRTKAPQWLAKACRAGDDLVNAQLANGHFPNSGFERNPSSAGTPHEAACDIGLLLLTKALPETTRYLACAERNLQHFYIDHLWDDTRQSFRDGIGTDTFVPNKAATACEAFFLWAEITERQELVDKYALPTLKRIIDYQIKKGNLKGAIAQNSLGSERIETYFPIYIARCVPALLKGYEWTNEPQFAESAISALTFIARAMRFDGTLPTVIYGNGKPTLYPNWVAPLADILRVAEMGRGVGFSADFTPLTERLNMGQDSSGGIQTATGFMAQSGQRVHTLPDLRDLLHVVGWCDKVLRWWAQIAPLNVKQNNAPVSFETACIFRGQRLHFLETDTQITLKHKQKIVYHWRKGLTFPETATPPFWLR